MYDKNIYYFSVFKILSLRKIDRCSFVVVCKYCWENKTGFQKTHTWQYIIITHLINFLKVQHSVPSSDSSLINVKLNIIVPPVAFRKGVTCHRIWCFYANVTPFRKAAGGTIISNFTLVPILEKVSLLIEYDASTRKYHNQNKWKSKRHKVT